MRITAALVALACVSCGPVPRGDDGGADVDAARTYCDPMPTNGTPCSASDLPAGFVCREHECLTTCQTTCWCTSGTWQCSNECRDVGLDGGTPPSCGTPPLCRATCS